MTKPQPAKLYHVWDTLTKQYLSTSQNSYAGIGSVFKTLHGVKLATFYHTGLPYEKETGDLRIARPASIGWSKEEHEAYWAARSARANRKAAWWKLNKDREFSDLFGQRYELHEIG